MPDVDFWLRVDRSGGPFACWPWLGARTAQGYGWLTVPGRRGSVYAHRFAYELERGPIPDGKQIDHLCRNHSCANPTHLEAVTSATNTLRGIGPTATNARKTHCRRGHEFTPENTRWQGGDRHYRVCRECHRATGVRATCPVCGQQRALSNISRHVAFCRRAAALDAPSGASDG